MTQMVLQLTEKYSGYLLKLLFFFSVLGSFGLRKRLYFIRRWPNNRFNRCDPYEHISLSRIHVTFDFECQFWISHHTARHAKWLYIRLDLHRVNELKQQWNKLIKIHYDYSKNRGAPFEYGVIMEIFETSLKRGTIHLKARGRQRCKIISINELRPMWGRFLRVSVKVLGEPAITSPIKDTQLLTLRQRRSTAVGDFEVLVKNYKYRK